MVKVAVVARHGINGNIGRGFVNGFGLKRGAIASSVGHDSHNICVVGADDGDMAVAVNRLIEIAGRLCRRRATARCWPSWRCRSPGLMSLSALRGGARRAAPAARGRARRSACTLAEPFLQVAFLPLPVIPHLKITDRGLVDVDRFELIEG